MKRLFSDADLRPRRHLLEWKNSRRVPDLDALAQLKPGDGPDLVIQGSSSLYPQLLRTGARGVVMTTYEPAVRWPPDRSRRIRRRRRN